MRKTDLAQHTNSFLENQVCIHKGQLFLVLKRFSDLHPWHKDVRDHIKRQDIFTDPLTAFLMSTVGNTNKIINSNDGMGIFQ